MHLSVKNIGISPAIGTDHSLVFLIWIMFRIRSGDFHTLNLIIHCVMMLIIVVNLMSCFLQGLICTKM